MQDYKSMHVVVVICVILVNTQTDTQLLICYTVSSANLATIDQRNVETVLSHGEEHHIVFSVIPGITCWQ